MKIALIEKTPSNIQYGVYFTFEFDKYSLTSKRGIKTVRKADIDISIDTNAYDLIILVGAEPVKQFTKASVTTHQGQLVNDKYIPVVSPNMLDIKPEVASDFKRAVNRINEYATGIKKVVNWPTLSGIQDTDEAIAELKNILLNASTVAIDTETSALYPRDGAILGISLSYNESEGCYIDTNYIDDTCEELLQEILDSKTIVMHNSKFDIKFLQYHFNLKFPEVVHDTMLLHYMLDENTPHGLKDLACKFTDFGDYEADLEVFKKNYCKKHKIKEADFTYDLIPFDIMYKYAAMDTVVTLILFNKFMAAFPKELEKAYYDLLLSGTRFFNIMEENGVPFSKEALDKANIELANAILQLEAKIYEYKEIHTFEEETKNKFNPNSVIHVRDVLFKRLKLPETEKLTGTGALSTDEEVLTDLAELHEFPKLLLAIKKAKKLKSTYVDKVLIGLDTDSRLRTGFNLHTTTSGRASSSGKLNMQQLPRKGFAFQDVYVNIKKCIEARQGYKIVSQDLGTAEMYIAAVLSGDKNLQKAFIDKLDYHGFMAVNKFGLKCHPNEVKTLYPDKRQDAKTISFEILYKLNYNEPVLGNFPQLLNWLKTMEQQVKTYGFVMSAFGRKRRVPNVRSSNKEEAQHAVRSAINSLVQSVSSDINLLAAIDMQKWIDANGYQKDMLIFALVHDSILAEVREDLVPLYCEKLKEFTQMDRGCSIPNCPIAVDVEIGDNYGFGK